jgi:hypothetical protein
MIYHILIHVVKIIIIILIKCKKQGHITSMEKKYFLARNGIYQQRCYVLAFSQFSR